MEITQEEAVAKLTAAGVPARLDFGGNLEIDVEGGTITFYADDEYRPDFDSGSMSLRPQPGESAKDVVNRVVTAARERS